MLLLLFWSLLRLFAAWFVCVAASLVVTQKTRQRRVHVDGHVHPHFRPVLDAFRENFKKGYERDGAAFCAFYKGECVVDIWGGYADRESDRFWGKDTMQIIFSTSKALAALCVAMLVDRKLLAYGDKVSSFWPEFGKNGKEDVTIEMILSHTAGLPYIEQIITWEDARDHEKMSKILEGQAPVWKPGTKVGYHCLSYGWLVDQIIRRVDPQHRSIGKFFRDEIAEKHHLDLYIGLPLELAWRVARISRPSMLERIEEYIDDPSIVDYPFWLKQYISSGLTYKVATNPPWIQTLFKVTINNPEMYTLEQTAGLGIGTARDMARLAQLVIDGRIVGQETLQLLNEPLISWKDVVTNVQPTRGRGITTVDVDVPGKIHSRLVGHAGLGGQNLRWDVDNQIAIAYLSNALKSGFGDRAKPYVRVLNQLYDCFPKEELNSAAAAS